ncbi:MAG: GNAT family N-acetyltransferase [Lachnospiraceae bacterium]|nr:GNAT family N-acetyltransferase [Lachnospiraceae bacterium]
MDIYKGIGENRCDNETLVDFLNYVFGMNGNDTGFHKLLPKLYKPEYSPEKHNFITTEDGRLRAAVGAYPFSLNFAGTVLSGIGIGNVAVHPMHRGKGYMKECMNLALDDMKKKGVDFAALGGRRQRYSYFGFEPAGVCGAFNLQKHNLVHVYGSVNSDTGFKAKKLTADDKAELDRIKALSQSRDYYPVRDTASYFDILSSWCAEVYSVSDAGGSFAGYFVYGGDAGNANVMEIDCTDPAKASSVLRACFEAIGADEINLDVPPFNVTFFELLSDISEGVTLSNTERFYVLNFEKVVRATLELKARYTKLADGELSLEIDGRAGQEKIRISVSDNAVSVRAYDGECDLKLSHRQATGVLFSLAVPEKKLLPGFAAGWFPLPLNTLGADNC